MNSLGKTEADAQSEFRITSLNIIYVCVLFTLRKGVDNPMALVPDLPQPVGKRVNIRLNRVAYFTGHCGLQLLD